MSSKLRERTESEMNQRWREENQRCQLQGGGGGRLSALFIKCVSCVTRDETRLLPSVLTERMKHPHRWEGKVAGGNRRMKSRLGFFPLFLPFGSSALFALENRERENVMIGDAND